MSWANYDGSRILEKWALQLGQQSYGPQYDAFYALLTAAVRQADTENLRKLEAEFPEVIAELRARYNAPGGKLAGER